jgi:hypothetical protein
MRRLFELRPWYKLVPDQSVITAGQGKGEDYVRAARAEDGSFAIAYLPSGKPVTIKMDKVAGKSVKGQWYDPTNGKFQHIADSPFANNGSRQFTPQGKNSTGSLDWVLVLESEKK